MYITEKNLRVADTIVKTLIKEECTIPEARTILNEVSRGIEAFSMVQIKESYTEHFSDVLNKHQ